MFSKSLMLKKPAFIWSKQHTVKHIVKCYCKLKCFLFEYNLTFKKLRTALSSVSHDPSEIISKCCVPAQEIFHVIVNVENS